jgi:hypothetical protein
MDGRSLIPFLRGGAPSTWRSDFLVEHFSAGASNSLRTPEYLYTDLESNEREIYDMRRDPFQLDSLFRTADKALMGQLSARATTLSQCRGASCRN